jgi:DNA-binding NarL/FixJ family response regulator
MPSSRARHALPTLKWVQKLEQPVRVLIVDDQEPFRSVARAVVESTEGFEVAGEAETGSGSVDAARLLKPDLVLLDVNLPDFSGVEAARQILAEQPQVAIVLVSTYEADEYSPRAAEVGAVYLPKSEFGPERLAATWAEATAASA